MKTIPCHTCEGAGEVRREDEPPDHLETCRTCGGTGKLEASLEASGLVEAIIDELYGRKGFDDWWGNLDDDIKDEIKTALLKLIPVKS